MFSMPYEKSKGSDAPKSERRPDQGYCFGQQWPDTRIIKNDAFEETRTSDPSHAIVREQDNTLIFSGNLFADYEKPHP